MCSKVYDTMCTPCLEKSSHAHTTQTHICMHLHAHTHTRTSTQAHTVTREMINAYLDRFIFFCFRLSFFFLSYMVVSVRIGKSEKLICSLYLYSTCLWQRCELHFFLSFFFSAVENSAQVDAAAADGGWLSETEQYHSR